MAALPPRETPYGVILPVRTHRSHVLITISSHKFKCSLFSYIKSETENTKWLLMMSGLHDFTRRKHRLFFFFSYCKIEVTNGGRSELILISLLTSEHWIYYNLLQIGAEMTQVVGYSGCLTTISRHIAADTPEHQLTHM